MKTEVKRVFIQRTGRISDRIEALNKWLDKQPLDPRIEQMHLDAGSHEQLYWHFGYLVALMDVAKLLNYGGVSPRAECCMLMGNDIEHLCPDCPKRKQ